MMRDMLTGTYIGESPTDRWAIICAADGHWLAVRRGEPSIETHGLHAIVSIAPDSTAAQIVDALRAAAATEAGRSTISHDDARLAAIARADAALPTRDEVNADGYATQVYERAYSATGETWLAKAAYRRAYNEELARSLGITPAEARNLQRPQQ